MEIWEATRLDKKVTILEKYGNQKCVGEIWTRKIVELLKGQR